MLKFGPLMTAMVTPYDEYNQISPDRIRKLVLHLLKHQSSSLVVTGTTGEAPALTALERLRVWETVVDFAGGLVPIVAGIGTNNTKTTVHNAKLAEEVGVDALLVVTPYYVKPTQEGLLAHFQAVSRATNLPIILYNVPSRTGVNLELETIVELAKLENIVGIKEAGGGIERLKALKATLPENFLIYTGEDALYLDALALGCEGAVSVASHVIGTQMNDVFDLMVENQLEAATELNTHLLPVYETLFVKTNPIVIKSVLNEMGICVGELRLPLVPLKPYESATVYEALKTIIDK